MKWMYREDGCRRWVKEAWKGEKGECGKQAGQMGGREV